eukprot:g1303.t1
MGEEAQSAEAELAEEDEANDDVMNAENAQIGSGSVVGYLRRMKRNAFLASRVLRRWTKSTSTKDIKTGMWLSVFLKRRVKNGANVCDAASPEDADAAGLILPTRSSNKGNYKEQVDPTRTTKLTASKSAPSASRPAAIIVSKPDPIEDGERQKLVRDTERRERLILEVLQRDVEFLKRTGSVGYRLYAKTYYRKWGPEQVLTRKKSTGEKLVKRATAIWKKGKEKIKHIKNKKKEKPQTSNATSSWFGRALWAGKENAGRFLGKVKNMTRKIWAKVTNTTNNSTAAAKSGPDRTRDTLKAHTRARVAVVTTTSYRLKKLRKYSKSFIFNSFFFNSMGKIHLQKS